MVGEYVYSRPGNLDTPEGAIYFGKSLGGY